MTALAASLAETAVPTASPGEASDILAESASPAPTTAAVPTDEPPEEAGPTAAPTEAGDDDDSNTPGVTTIEDADDFTPLGAEELGDDLEQMEEIGEEAVNRRDTTHYRGDRFDFANADEAQLDVWLDNEYGFIVKMELIAAGRGLNIRLRTLRVVSNS